LPIWSVLNRRIARSIGPVAQVIAIGERPVGLADLLEIERLLVELGHCIGVLGGNGDVTQLGHL